MTGGLALLKVARLCPFTFRFLCIWTVHSWQNLVTIEQFGCELQCVRRKRRLIFGVLVKSSSNSLIGTPKERASRNRDRMELNVQGENESENCKRERERVRRCHDIRLPIDSECWTLGQSGLLEGHTEIKIKLIKKYIIHTQTRTQYIYIWLFIYFSTRK